MTPHPRARTRPRHIAIIGGGMAGVACARTLDNAGCTVTLFEREPAWGGRTASRDTPFGRFDAGAQYFTVRDPRFAQALETVPGLCRPWSANAVRVLDPLGRVIEAARPGSPSHWVPRPGMDALVQAWAEPLAQAGRASTGLAVTGIEPDALRPGGWQLRTLAGDGAVHVHAGFDAVLLALPAPETRRLLAGLTTAAPLAEALRPVAMAPCWTLMLAFPNAVQPGLSHLGPQWNAARSTHHRLAWLARESSKPGRGPVERWTVQAGAAWSTEHRGDGADRVSAKLLKAFAEVTGIRATPAHVETQFWPYARTEQPLGQSHLWDAAAGLGVCGDWCIGHRLEDAFVSGLSLALDLVQG